MGSVVSLVLLIIILIFCIFFAFLSVVYARVNWKDLVSVFKRKSGSRSISEQEREAYLKNLVESLIYLSERKIGALIINEQRNSLNIYEESGYQLKADFVPGFVISVFSNKNASFHDGALIVSGNRITAISCYVPISKKHVDIKYGARHRAAIGVSEVTDAIAFVVSETTGNISFAKKGELNLLGKERKEIEENLKRLI